MICSSLAVCERFLFVYFLFRLCERDLFFIYLLYAKSCNGWVGGVIIFACVISLLCVRSIYRMCGWIRLYLLAIFSVWRYTVTWGETSVRSKEVINCVHHWHSLFLMIVQMMMNHRFYRRSKCMFYGVKIGDAMKSFLFNALHVSIPNFDASIEWALHAKLFRNFTRLFDRDHMVLKLNRSDEEGKEDEKKTSKEVKCNEEELIGHMRCRM